MRIKLVISSLVAVGSILAGSYWLGNTAYQDGVRAGISAVVEQCAHQHTTIYNGDTGDVMVCDGGHMSAPEKAPENTLPGASSPTPPVPEHKKERDFIGDPIPEQNI